MTATVLCPVIKTGNGRGKGLHHEKEGEQKTSHHGNLCAWNFGHKNNIFPSSSLSLLIFCFPLLCPLKVGNIRMFDANWATPPSENNLTGRLERVGSAQAWIRSPVCLHPLPLPAQVPSCKQAIAAPSPGLAPRFCWEQHDLALHLLLWSTANTITRLRSQTGKERRSCHTRSIWWSIHRASPSCQQVLQSNCTGLRESCVPTGGFPTPGSCGLACAVPSGSLTSSLEQKMSQILTQAAQLLWIHSVCVWIKSTSFDPTANVTFGVCLFFWFLIAVGYTLVVSPAVHCDRSLQPIYNNQSLNFAG